MCGATETGIGGVEHNGAEDLVRGDAILDVVSDCLVGGTVGTLAGNGAYCGVTGAFGWVRGFGRETGTLVGNGA